MPIVVQHKVHRYTIIPKVLYMIRRGRRISFAIGSGRVQYVH